MRTWRVMCPLLSQKVTLLARNGSSGAGCTLPSNGYLPSGRKLLFGEAIRLKCEFARHRSQAKMKLCFAPDTASARDLSSMTFTLRYSTT
jgi:hypothetical protein